MEKNKNPKPLVSVITVCRNAAETIEDTIKNVASQSFPDTEYIVVDGLSSDSTVAIIKKQLSSIDIFISEKDNGIYDAMNKGVKAAKGEWIIFMNSGDFFADPFILEKLALHLQDPDLDVIYGDIYVPSEDGTLALKNSEAPRNRHRMFFCHQSAFVRRKWLIKQPFDIRYKLSADFKFFKRMYLSERHFLKVDMPVSIFDKKGISNTQRNRGLRENIEIIKETDNLLDQMKLLPRLYFVIFWNMIRNKK